MMGPVQLAGQARILPFPARNPVKERAQAQAPRRSKKGRHTRMVRRIDLIREDPLQMANPVTAQAVAMVDAVIDMVEDENSEIDYCPVCGEYWYDRPAIIAKPERPNPHYDEWEAERKRLLALPRDKVRAVSGGWTYGPFNNPKTLPAEPGRDAIPGHMDTCQIRWFLEEIEVASAAG